MSLSNACGKRRVSHENILRAAVRTLVPLSPIRVGSLASPAYHISPRGTARRQCGCSWPPGRERNEMLRLFASSFLGTQARDRPRADGPTRLGLRMVRLFPCCAAAQLCAGTGRRLRFCAWERERKPVPAGKSQCRKHQRFSAQREPRRPCRRPLLLLWSLLTFNV